MTHAERQRQQRNQARARRRSALAGRRRLRARGRLKETKIPPLDGPIWNRVGTHRRLDQAELRVYGAGVTEFSDGRSEVVPLMRLFVQTDFARVLAEEVDAGRPEPRVCGKPGRRRMPGRWEYLYLAYVLTGATAMMFFYNRLMSLELLQVCGFDHVPAYSELALRFKELEHSHWQAFRKAGQATVRFAKSNDDKIGNFWMYDGSEFLSEARLEHCCPDDAYCRAAAAQHGAAPAYMPRLDDEHIKEIRAADRRALMPDDVDSEWVPPSVVASLRIEGGFQYFKVRGHIYRSRDLECGLRKYDDRNSSYTHSWFGGSIIPIVDLRYGTAIAGAAAAADEMEWDNFDDVYEAAVAATGDPPLAVSADGLSGVRDWYEYLLRRGVMPITPFRQRRSRRDRDAMRCDLYDQHQVPRCPGCGGEGTVTGTGLGLRFTRGGDPFIRFRCVLPQIRACYGRNGYHDQPCDAEWTMLTPLNLTHETYHALRAAHQGFERTFGTFRGRYSVGGKDKRSRLKRLGTEAQHLRLQAAIILDWFQIALRMGWLRGGTRRFEGEDRKFGGTGRLARSLQKRINLGLIVPYGGPWERLKAERRARRQAGMGPPQTASP